MQTFQQWLNEADIVDTHARGFVEFYDKYFAVPEAERANLWVRFAPSTMHKMALDNRGIHTNPMGVYVFPLDYVLKNPHQLTYGATLPYLHVLRSDINPVDLRTMTRDDVESYMFGSKWRGGLNDRSVAEYLIDKKGMTPGKAFMQVVSNYWTEDRQKDKDGTRRFNGYAVYKSRDGAYQRKILLSAGIRAVKDNSDIFSDSAIHSGNPQQAIFLNLSDVRQVDVFAMGQARERPGKQLVRRNYIHRDTYGNKTRRRDYEEISHGDTDGSNRRTGTLQHGSTNGRTANDRTRYTDRNGGDVGPMFSAESDNQTKFNIESKAVHGVVAKLFPGSQQVHVWPTGFDDDQFVGNESARSKLGNQVYAFVSPKSGKLVIVSANFRDMRRYEDMPGYGKVKVQNLGRSIPAVLTIVVLTENDSFYETLPHAAARKVEDDLLSRREKDFDKLRMIKMPPVSEMVDEFAGLYNQVPHARRGITYEKLPDKVKRIIEDYRTRHRTKLKPLGQSPRDI